MSFLHVVCFSLLELTISLVAMQLKCCEHTYCQ